MSTAYKTMSSYPSAHYDLLKTCFARLIEIVMPDFDLPAHQHPIAFLDRVERDAPQQAGKGLELGLNDLVELTLDWPRDDVAEIDEAFISDGLMSLSQLQRRYLQAWQPVLERGSIDNIEEYYLLKGMLDAGRTDDFDVTVTAMLEAYEVRHACVNAD